MTSARPAAVERSFSVLPLPPQPPTLPRAGVWVHLASAQALAARLDAGQRAQRDMAAAVRLFENKYAGQMSGVKNQLQLQQGKLQELVVAQSRLQAASARHEALLSQHVGGWKSG